MKNNTYEELAEVIRNANSIYLFTHIHMDGDALGSSAALCKAIRSMGKECFIIIEDKIPDNLEFLNKEYCADSFNTMPPADLSVCVDCSNMDRFPKRKELFAAGGISMCIDHHRTSEFGCDYNYIDSSAAATGQLVYRLILALGVQIDKEIGEALFAAITTDTGNFQYSNTSKDTHEIIAALYDAGIDANRVSVELYENVRKERLMIENRALSTLEMFCDGQIAMAYVTQEMLKETGAMMEETENVVQQLRSMKGVEVAVFLKEIDRETVKVSMRSKQKVDVSAISAEFNGGGHIRAAGCTLHCNIEEAIKKLSLKLTDSLERL